MGKLSIYEKNLYVKIAPTASWLAKAMTTEFQPRRDVPWWSVAVLCLLALTGGYVSLCLSKLVFTESHLLSRWLALYPLLAGIGGIGLGLLQRKRCLKKEGYWGERVWGYPESWRVTLGLGGSFLLGLLVYVLYPGILGPVLLH